MRDLQDAGEDEQGRVTRWIARERGDSFSARERRLVKLPGQLL